MAHKGIKRNQCLNSGNGISKALFLFIQSSSQEMLKRKDEEGGGGGQCRKEGKKRRKGKIKKPRNK